MENGGIAEKSIFESADSVDKQEDLVFKRYCHVYKEGELEDLCSGVPGCRIHESGFDKGNWFVVFEKIDTRLLLLSGIGPTSMIPDPHIRNLKY